LQLLREGLPGEVGKQVTLDKNGFIDKAALNKIDSKDQNFLDLKEMVNAKGTVEFLSASKDERGQEFLYDTPERIKAEITATLQKEGASKEEIAETVASIDKPNLYLGRPWTLKNPQLVIFG